MSDLYINKKIDSLGRIVIPKEIRKRMHIMENENLDITYENDKVVIKKSSSDLYNKRLFETVLEAIRKQINLNIGIFDINGTYFDKSEIKLSEKEYKRIFEENKYVFENYEVFPINPNGILYGGLILKAEDNDEINYKVCKCFQKFIEKYLEE